MKMYIAIFFGRARRLFLRAQLFLITYSRSCVFKTSTHIGKSTQILMKFSEIVTQALKLNWIVLINIPRAGKSRIQNLLQFFWRETRSRFGQITSRWSTVQCTNNNLKIAPSNVILFEWLLTNSERHSSTERRRWELPVLCDVLRLTQSRVNHKLWQQSQVLAPSIYA